MATNTPSTGAETRALLIGRRQVLGVVAAAPAMAIPVPSIAAPVSEKRAAWEVAWLALESEQRRDALVNDRYEKACKAGAWTQSLEEEWSDSAEPLCDAEWALFMTPAPDLAALEWKIQHIADRGLQFEQDIADRLLSDVRDLRREG